MKSILLSIAVIPFFFASCAQQSLTGDAYSRGEAGQAQTVHRGTISSIRNVKIEGSSTGGTVLGAVAGGLLGNQVGSGSGRRAATVGGAAAGGIAGSHIGKEVTSRPGLEIQVDLDKGGSVSIVQQVNPREPFAVGDRVRVLGGGRRARVTY